MIELHPLKHRSTNVFAIGFEATDGHRGNLHVQFHDGNGNPTTRGYYRDAPRAIYNALASDRKPGVFLNQNLKNRFEWVSPKPEEAPEITYARANPDSTIPDLLFIPAHIPNTLEAIQTCIDSQRNQTKGLFE